MVRGVAVPYRMVSKEEAVLLLDGKEVHVFIDGRVPYDTHGMQVLGHDKNLIPVSTGLVGDCLDQVAGNGQVEVSSKDPVSFVVKIDGAKGNTALTEITYSDVRRGLSFRATTLEAFFYVSDFERRLQGAGIVNGVPGTYDILIRDDGNKDRFEIRLSSGYNGAGKLVAGNIALTKVACAKTPATPKPPSSPPKPVSPPKPPASPASPASPGSPNSVVVPQLTFPLVLCIERGKTTQGGDPLTYDPTIPSEGSVMPFASYRPYVNYRNQYLYPSTSLQALRTAGIHTIESMHARAVSFMSTISGGGNAYNYLDPSVITIRQTAMTLLDRTFDSNQVGVSADHLTRKGPLTVNHAPGTAFGGTNTDPFVLSNITVCKNGIGANVADCNHLDNAIVLPAIVPPTQNILVDMTMYISGAGNSGIGVWDITPGFEGCEEPQRAYGTSTFINPNRLTTAYGVDNKAFVWVFEGLAVPVPVTFTGATANLLDMLLTPKGMRASGLARNR